MSKAQLRGCESHVTEKQIAMLDTNAALLARHKLTVRLEDAGRFCPATTASRSSAVTHGAPKPGPGGFGDTPNGGSGAAPNGGFGSGALALDLSEGSAAPKNGRRREDRRIGGPTPLQRYAAAASRLVR